MKNITPKRLENIALFYLGRYDSNSSKLRQVLMRRIYKARQLGQDVSDEANQWAEDVICHMQDLGYINDQRYAENTVRRLSQSGKSMRFIRGKLLADGVSSDLAEEMTQDVDEYALARIFYRKKKLGQDPEKDLAKMARAGFSYEVAHSIIQENQDV